MSTGGKPLANEGNDPRLCSCETTGKFNVIDISKYTALFHGLIFPGNAEKVAGIDIPQPDGFQFLFGFIRNQSRVLHLGNGGDDDVLFPRPLDGILLPFRIYFQIDLRHDYFSCAFLLI